MEEIVIKNEGRWESSDLPVGSYFKCHDSNTLKDLGSNHIILKVYGNDYINIVNGKMTWGRNTNFKQCELITDIKILLP